MSNQKHFVYFIQEVKESKSSPVKIGVAINPTRRLNNMQTGNPRQLCIRAQLGPFTSLQAYEYEKQLHRRFRRQNLRGEWFSGAILSRLKIAIQ